MRKRLLLSVGLFGLLLSLLFGALLFAVFFKAEDAVYRRLLHAAEKGDSVVRDLDDLPSDLAERVHALPPGYHELDVEGSEIHVRSSADGATVLRVPESARSERLLEFGILGVVLLGGAAAFGLAAMLVSRSVRPIEQLTAWLGHADPNRPVPVSSEPELQVLGQALNAHLLQSQSQTERERAFLREASHELRTPLTILRGVYETAETDGLSDAALQRFARSTRRMEHTIEGLLALARSEQAILPSSFADEWQALAAEFRDGPGTRPVLSMNLRVEPTEPLAARLLILALGTLLRNAAEHAGAGTVEVHLDQESLVVRDDGQGMENLPAIRTALETLHPPPGGGLGLSLVQRICRRMDWHFHLENLSTGFEARIAFQA